MTKSTSCAQFEIAAQIVKLTSDKPPTKMILHQQDNTPPSSAALHHI